MKKRFFITATDTDAGKTYVTCQLLDYYREQGLSAVGIKPVASGAEVIDGQLISRDAYHLMAHSSDHLDYKTVNPVLLEPAIAPHIAAKQASHELSVEGLYQALLAIHHSEHDVILYEGAGGWCVPLNDNETWADFCLAMDLPVILVVGMKLGCINHALLSEQAIKASGLNCHGWIANQLDPEMPVYQENLKTLQHYLDVPMLGEVSSHGHFKPA